MELTDGVAAHVLGEIYTLTKKIDTQSQQVINSTKVINEAANLIKKNSEIAVENSKKAMHNVQIEISEKFKINISHEVAKTLNNVAGAVATKSATKWIIFGILLSSILFILIGFTGYKIGKDAGSAFGYAKARNEIAANSWANTHNGKLAYLLDKTGSLPILAYCTGPGWYKEDGYCFVEKKDGITTGWKMP